MDNDIMEKTKKEVEKNINKLVEQGIQTGTVDTLYKLVDIHKDIENENHWKKKEENDMRYYDENMYGGGRRRDSRGRYMTNGMDRTNYNAYNNYENDRGMEHIDDMYNNYSAYKEGRNEYSRGNYGAKGETIKSLDYMLQSVVDFVEMLKRDATSQEEIDMIKKYARKIGEM